MIPDIKRYELQIASNPMNITQVEPFVEQVRQESEFKDEVYGNMLVAVTEAVNNAIAHGNSGDESKSVFISIIRENQVISCIVRDEGKGFDYNNLPDPTSPENLEKLTGRGVFLMKQLSDLVIFSDSGNEVEIQFKI